MKTPAMEEPLQPEMPWYFSDNERLKSPLMVYHSVHSTGGDRLGGVATRHMLAGNMSEKWFTELAEPERRSAADKNLERFFRVIRVDPEQVVILSSQRDYRKPLGQLNVDDMVQTLPDDGHAKRLTDLGVASDFMYTRNPEQVLAVRPADCPIVIGRGIDAASEPLMFMCHLAWGALNAGYAEQLFDHLTELGIKKDSLRLYVTGGAQPKSFTRTQPENPLVVTGNHPDRAHLFVDVHDTEKGFTCNLDMFGFLRRRFEEARVADEQVFWDDSDTAAIGSGYSSHTRASNAGLKHSDNSRDVILAKWH